ncbi:KPN_02809 family neutral zinc metallopeptidase [Gordonia sp. DT218]|uniref:KPN_02809 family neutral zinc metallopeptidase n=1 Tax=Gordonia sp. DT218 TaxID=3416659 RepID=UPI003CE6A35F
MVFQGDGPLDTSGVSGGGGGGVGRIALGGGAGLIITLVALFFGIDPGSITGGSGLGNDTVSSQNASELDDHIQSCTIEKANTDAICRIVATTNSLNTVWSAEMRGYTPPKTRIFTGSTSTGCGAATSATGPFYCPADQTVYIDPSFFAQLEQMGGSDGPLAQEYVVAHEYGHHVQNLTGALQKGNRMGSQGPLSGSVRVELQADCLAGVWAYHADKGPDAMLEPLTQQQIAGVIQTAKAIGDDTIQGANSNPEGWTHGSAQQRSRWFTIGYRSGDPRHCDTFATNDL